MHQHEFRMTNGIYISCPYCPYFEEAQKLIAGAVNVRCQNGMLHRSCPTVADAKATITTPEQEMKLEGVIKAQEHFYTMGDNQVVAFKSLKLALHYFAIK